MGKFEKNMSALKVFLALVILLKISTVVVQADDFPSLLTANASIAIILDREYLENKYDLVLEEVKVIVERVLREDLKNGGLIVFYYSWTKINLKKDFTAVFSVSNCERTWELFRDSQPENLLLLSITEPDCPRLPIDRAIMIPTMTPGEELPQVILDSKAKHAFAWKSATLLYDNTFDRDMISRCVIALSRDFPDINARVKPLSLTVFRIKEMSHDWDRRKNVRNILKSLPLDFIGRNYLVLVTTKLMQTVMEVARDLRMVDAFSQWFYVISDTNFKYNNISSVLPLIDDGNNIAFIYNFTRSDETCVSGIACHANELLKSFVLGLSKMIREEKAVYGQISDEEWEVIRPSKRERRNSLLKFMEDSLMTSSKCSNCTTWRVESGEMWGDTYGEISSNEDSVLVAKNAEIDLTRKLSLVGFWKPTNGLQMSDVLFPHVSHGFRQKNFHVITYHNPPWQIISFNESEVSTNNSRGVIIDVLKEISRKLNFTITFHVTNAFQVNANMTLNEDYNGSFSREVHLLTTYIPSDVLSLVQENKVFIAAVGATVNDRYKRYLNFTMPISIQPYSFMVAKPRELSRIYLFMAPFTYDTWLCVAATMFMVAPILYVINKLSPYYEFHGISTKVGLGKIDNCFWYVYGALIQQGGMYLPSADSGRIIIGAWWLVVIVIVTSYCGNLVAFLTFPKIDVQLKTVDELVAQDSKTWGLKMGTYLEEYMKETDIPKYQKLYKGTSFYLEESDDIINDVRIGKHVYIDWKINLQYIMKREFLKKNSCDFSYSVEEFMEEQISMLMPANSPYLDIVNLEIKRLHQAGFIERWLKEYLPKRDRCWKQVSYSEVENHTVNIDDMQGSFLVLLFGFGGGFGLFLMECLWKWHKSSKNREIIKPFVE